MTELGCNYCNSVLIAASGHTCSRRCAGFLAAASGLRGSFRSFADQFHGHQAGDEFLKANAVEIDGGALDVRFGHDPESILLVLDALPFRKNLHYCLLENGGLQVEPVPVFVAGHFGALLEVRVRHGVAGTDPRVSD